MLYYILVFILGFVLGGLIMWIYGQVTDKLNIAKAGYGIGKSLLIFGINKFKKK